MLFRRSAANRLLFCLVITLLVFSTAACVSKKHNTGSTSGTASTGSTAAQTSNPSTVTGASSETPSTQPDTQPAQQSGTQTGLLGGTGPSTQQSNQYTGAYGAYAPWTGKWDTVFFRYGGVEHKTIWELKQDQIFVTGTYPWDNGRLKCKQTKTSGLMQGTWSEAPTYLPPDDAGDIELQQSIDGNSFTGKWRYGSTGDWVGEWNGKRIR